MNLGAYISIGSAVTAFVSATLWVIAARARVSYDPKPNEDGFIRPEFQMEMMTSLRP